MSSLGQFIGCLSLASKRQGLAVSGSGPSTLTGAARQPLEGLEGPQEAAFTGSLRGGGLPSTLAATRGLARERPSPSGLRTTLDLDDHH